MAGARHGMCELKRNGVAKKRHGRGMGAVWHVWISLNGFQTEDPGGHHFFPWLLLFQSIACEHCSLNQIFVTLTDPLPYVAAPIQCAIHLTALRLLTWSITWWRKQNQSAKHLHNILDTLHRAQLCFKLKKVCNCFYAHPVHCMGSHNV
jgi:hypothetical protein